MIEFHLRKGIFLCPTQFINKCNDIPTNNMTIIFTVTELGIRVDAPTMKGKVGATHKANAEEDWHHSMYHANQFRHLP